MGTYIRGTSRTGRPWSRTVARILRIKGTVCHLCGQPGSTSADHLIPYSFGGTDDDTNLAPAHIDCNRRRGNRPIEVARAELWVTPIPIGWRLDGKFQSAHGVVTTRDWFGDEEKLGLPSLARVRADHGRWGGGSLP